MKTEMYKLEGQYYSTYWLKSKQIEEIHFKIRDQIHFICFERLGNSPFTFAGSGSISDKDYGKRFSHENVKPDKITRKIITI